MGVLRLKKKDRQNFLRSCAITKRITIKNNDVGWCIHEIQQEIFRDMVLYFNKGGEDPFPRILSKSLAFEVASLPPG